MKENKIKQRVCLVPIFKNSFIFSRTKKKKQKHISQLKIIFYFLFKKIQVALREYFLVVFTYFVRIILKNNYINM